MTAATAVGSMAARPRRVAEIGVRVAQAATVAVLVALWARAGRSARGEAMFSSPAAVADVLRDWAGDPQRWNDLWVTVQEGVAGCLLGTLGGTAFALLVHSSRSASKVISPWLAVFNALPKVALAPLFIMWFGLGMSSKVYFVFATVMFISYSTVLAGLRGIDPVYIAHVRLLGARRRELWRTVYAPAISLWLMTGLRLSFSWALLSAVLAEYLGAREGIGKTIAGHGFSLEQDGVIAGILVVSMVALLVDRAIVRVERRMTRWQVEL